MLFLLIYLSSSCTIRGSGTKTDFNPTFSVCFYLDPIRIHSSFRIPKVISDKRKTKQIILKIYNMSSNIKFVNQHNKAQASKLCSGMEVHRALGNWCDVTLVADLDGQKISAHRIVLAASSRYFHAMFSCAFMESKQNVVTIQEVQGDHLIPLIKYCYTGELMITAANVKDLMCAASMLQFNDVLEMCASFIETILEPVNCLGFSALAEHLSSPKLMRRTDEFICEHFREVCQTEEFLNLDVEELAALVISDELNVTSEEVVFEAVMTWLQHQPLLRSEYVHQLMELVRLPLLTVDFLKNRVEPVCIGSGCQEVLLEAAKWHQMPDSRSELDTPQTKPRKGQSGLLAIFGGGTNDAINIQKYCPQTHDWTTFAEVHSTRHEFATTMCNGQLLLVGGCDSSGILSSAESFDLVTRASAQLQPMLVPRKRLGLAVLDDHVYAVGGLNGEQVLSSVERYDVHSQTWEFVAPMPTARYGAAVVALSGRLYVIGGVDGYRALQTTEVYDPETNEWTTKANMTEGRQRFGVVASKGFLYAVGGGENGFTNYVERYDQQRDEWTQICSLSCVPYMAYPTFLAGSRLVVVLSKFDEGVELSLAVEEFDAKANKFEERSETTENCIGNMFDFCGIVALP